MSEERSRTTAEWVTFAVAMAVLSIVVGLILVQVIGWGGRPAPVVHVEKVRAVGEQFHVDVLVTNDGDETAASVQVNATLETGGESVTADQTIDFLAGDERNELVFVFQDDPGDGKLTVAVTGYAVP